MSETTTTPAAAAPTNVEAPAAAPAPAAPAPPQALATAKAAPPVVKFDPDNPVDMYMDSTVFGQLQRVGRMMAASSLVPDHLKGKEADCCLIAAQAFRWRMDPFAVADFSYVVYGSLGYEGKLVAALVNSCPKLQGNLRYEYSGTKGDKRTVRVVQRLRGENEDRDVTGTVEEWATKEKDGRRSEKWIKGEDQMLAYRGAREWARRHVPEVLLGIKTVDEIQPPIDLKPGLSGTFAADPKTLDDAAAALAGRTEPAAPAATAAAPPVAERIVGEDDDDDGKPTAAAAAQEQNPFERGRQAAGSKESAGKPRQGRLE